MPFDVRKEWTDKGGTKFSYGWGFEVEKPTPPFDKCRKCKTTYDPKNYRCHRFVLCKGELRSMIDKKFAIKKVIFNHPATIVFWEDGTKTIVKAYLEQFDPEKGLSMAIAKKALGNEGNYFNQIKKWTKKYDDEVDAKIDWASGWLINSLARMKASESDSNEEETKDE